MNNRYVNGRVIFPICLLLSGFGNAVSFAQSSTNFIRQVHQATGVQWDVTVGNSGTRHSVLPILPGGSRFELWTVESNPMTSYLLDIEFANLNLPKSNIRLVS